MAFAEDGSVGVASAFRRVLTREPPHSEGVLAHALHPVNAENLVPHAETARGGFPLSTGEGAMKKIDAQQLKAMRDRNEDFLLVNTLDEEHFNATRIPGATNIPQSHDDFVRRIEELAGGKDKQIVVYCANTQCESSKQGAKKLGAAGFTNVSDFEDGAQGWKDAGEQLAVG